MHTSGQSRVRSRSLAWRLTACMGAAALLVAVVLGVLGARQMERRAAAAAEQAEVLQAEAVAERIAPLLERGDWVRLALVTAVARDPLRVRLVVLDAGHRVVLDTAHLQVGDSLAASVEAGFSQRLVRRDPAAAEDSPLLRETAVPLRCGGERVGELRLQSALPAPGPVFDFTWFGLALLGGLTLVVVAAAIAYQWSCRVREATDAMLRLAAGERAATDREAGDADFQQLGVALREMERGLQDGLQAVGAGYAAMALQLVEGLERHRLVPRGRGERCARLAGQMADQLQMVAADREDVVLAARLVDLGKAWVRPAILSKQGPLSPEELASLRQHPERGAEHLEPMPALRRVAAIVRCQAERYDGRGPQGLRGDRIPLGARILALAGAFDEWTAGAGEASLDWPEALERMQASSGEAYDPWLFEVFATCVATNPPPAVVDRQVLIVPVGAAEQGEAAEVDPAEGEDPEQEIEVVLEEGVADSAEEGSANATPPA